MSNLLSIAETIKKFGLSAKKSLGQNFIYDLNVTSKIARLTKEFNNNESILEIGPGPGSLTRSLLIETKSNIIAIEKDNRCINALDELSKIYKSRLILQQLDALDLRLKDIVQNKINIVSNLPYNISTVLLANWLGESEFISGMVLMFQKEVAERIVAQPRTKAYGRLSVLAQLKSIPKISLVFPPSIFQPAPKIDSAVVIFHMKQEKINDELWHAVQKVTKESFQHRRKLLFKNLRSLFVNPKSVLQDFSISCDARAEELTPTQFLLIAKSYISVR